MREFPRCTSRGKASTSAALRPRHEPSSQKRFEPEQAFTDIAPPLISEETFGAAHATPTIRKRANAWLRVPFSADLTAARLRPVAYSFADQALAVGGSFLVNVVLARTQTKEEYGMFALSYSVFTFLSGLHNAAILEPYTVYGSGRYRDRFSEYLRLIVRSNALFCLFDERGAFADRADAGLDCAEA